MPALATNGLLLGATAAVTAAGWLGGRAVLRAVGLRADDWQHGLERFVFEAAIGLGLVGTSIALLGLVGRLRVEWITAAIAAWGLTGAALAWRWPMPERSPSCGLTALSAGAGGARVSPQPTTCSRPGGSRLRHEWLLWAGLAAYGALVLVQALAPPTDYDGLMYHLPGARAFLAAGRLFPISDNFAANYPFLLEMLFAAGLAWGSSRFAALSHYAFGALLVLGTAALARRVYGSARTASWAAVALVTAPLVALLGSRAYVDLATALYSLLAVHAFLVWERARARRWLLLSGACCGLALATKYGAAYLLVTLLVTVAWVELRRGVRGAATQGAWLLAPALLLAAPWYVKNWLWLDNPVFPLFMGGADWTAARTEQFAYLSGNYGQGRGLQDYVKLPWTIFTQSVTFGHMPDAYPPLLGLLAPLALLGTRAAGRLHAAASAQRPMGRAAWWLIYFVAAGTALWTLGWQDLRFLLPVYPLLAVLAAGALLRVTGARAIGGHLLAPALALFALGATVVTQIAPAADRWPVVVGWEQRERYLSRRLYDFGGVQYVNAHVPPEEAVLLLGDGQIFYCRPRCLPDTAHDNAWRWFTVPGSAEAARDLLRQASVTHILLSRPDIWYLEHLDPERRMARQLADFFAFKGRYLDTVYADWAVDVYRVRSQPGSATLPPN